MRSWYVKGKGLAPARCVMTKGDWAWGLLIGLPVGVVAIGCFLGFSVLR